MKCPYCLDSTGASSRTHVLESRQEVSPEAGPRVRRRRECAVCERRFTSFESIERGVMVDARGKRRAFSPARLQRSLLTLNTDLPVSQIEEIVSDIQRRVDAHTDEIEIATLVRWVAGGLPDPETRTTYLEKVGGYNSEEARLAASGEVIKRAGKSPDWFDRKKLRDAIGRAAFTLIAAVELDKIADDIEQRVIESHEPIPTTTLRTWVETELRRRNDRAWLRYAAGRPEASLQEILRLVTKTPHGHVRKSDDSLEAFDKYRLRSGLELALGKRERPAKFWERFDRFIESIGQEIRTSPEATSTATIVNQVLRWFKENDELNAFVSYLALHRHGLELSEITDEFAKWDIDVSAKL
jgi:transcriptional regulator NrdR family protein